MAEQFDPYHKWLGIPPKYQPPDHYRLLGLGHFESDPDVIDMAASRQMAHIRSFQNGPLGGRTQKLLNELATARICLLDAAQKKLYDRRLRDQLDAAGRLTTELPLEDAQPLVPPPVAPLAPVHPAPPQPTPPARSPALPPPISIAAPPLAPNAAPHTVTAGGRWKVSAELESPTAEGVALVPLPIVTAKPPPRPPSATPSSATPPALARFPRLNLASPAPRPVERPTLLGPVLLIAGLSLTAVVGVVIVALALAPSRPVAQAESSPHSQVSWQAYTGGASSVPSPNPGGKPPARAVQPSRGSTQPTSNEPTPFPLGGKAPEEPVRPRPRPALAPFPPPRPPQPSLPPLPANPAEAISRVRTLLSDARQALAARDDERAALLLVDAEQLLAMHREAAPAELLTAAQHLRKLYEYWKQFWVAVRDGVYEKTELGEQIELRKESLTLIERAGEEVTFRVADRSHTCSVRRLPAEAALLFALRSTGPDDGWGQAYAATFLLLDGRAMAPRFQQEARLLAQQAREKLGDEIPALLAELNLGS